MIKPKTHFDRLFLDCEIPSMMFIERHFDQLAAPNWPFPHPAFKGKDPQGTRFIYCRRPMRISHDDGTVTEGTFPVILFQRRFNKEAGLFLAFPREGFPEYVTQVCEDVKDFLPEITQSLVGQSVCISTTGSKVHINPIPEEETTAEITQSAAA